MALFDPVLDAAGWLTVVAGIGIVLGGLPYAAVTGQTPMMRTGLLYVAGGMLIFLGGVVLHPKTYDVIDVPGFKERSERAIWATLVLVSFGAYIFP